MLPVNLDHFIGTVGYLGIFVILFAETGLLIGFFLPGDSLLFTAGFLASQHILNIWILIPACILAAVLGDATGYQLGKRYGRGLFTRPKSKLFDPQRLVAAERFFARYGGRAVIVARFVPIARTFVPVTAGISHMPYRRFGPFNILGGVLWVGGVALLGYFLGHTIPGVDKYLLPIIALIVIISVIPSALHFWREYRIRDRSVGTAAGGDEP